MIQDQMVALGKGMSEPTEPVSIDAEFFLDGPVSDRVAVLDFEPSGRLTPPALFKPPSDPMNPGHYEGTEGAAPDIHSDSFIQVNAFATVLRTVQMFEEPDTLGRPLTWGFDAPQLFIVPRAGKWANAYYERDSHSLQFFYFPSARPEWKGQPVYTSLSHDIVAHETGHAVLDGIAPDLYNAITPQSLALHEAVADLTALMMAFRSDRLCRTVLKQTNGSIKKSTAFSSIAEEFGMQRRAEGPLRPLRSLLNDKRLPSSGGARTSPHELSEVLSGALYTVMVKMHENRIEAIVAKERKSEFSASGKALFVAREHFKRMVFRALDYLPPGEVSFADYGRAIIAADLASHPEWPREREWIATEFVKRNIVPNEDTLLNPQFVQGDVEQVNQALAGLDLQMLVESDWVAYEFVNRNRDSLGIPRNVPLWVRPRLDSTKEYRTYGGGTKDVRECILKVSWDAIEDNPTARGLPRKRQVTVGTTLAIDWKDRTVRALLTSDPSEEQRRDRDEMLLRLQRGDRLRAGREAMGPDGKLLRSVVTGEKSGDLLRVRNSARMLHIVGEEQ
jgi:hypothetical protein